MSKTSKNETKHAIDSIYSIEEKKSNKGLIIGITLTVVGVIALIILAALSMKGGAVDAAKNASLDVALSKFKLAPAANI